MRPAASASAGGPVGGNGGQALEEARGQGKPTPPRLGSYPPRTSLPPSSFRVVWNFWLPEFSGVVGC